MFAAIKKFLANVKGSQKGVLIPEELFRAILTSLGSGTVVGLTILVLQAVLNHVTAIFPDPAIASLASVSLTLILDLLRRQGHGEIPAPAAPDAVPATPR